MNYEKQEIAEFAKNGDKTMSDIEKTFGCSYRTIMRAKKEYGFVTSVEGGKFSKRYDWELIQKDFDSGMTWREIESKHGCTNTAILGAKRRGCIRTNCKSDAMKISHIKKPYLYGHSEETKEKISKIRKQYILDNPDKAPYLLNHSSKGPSYPEKYFASVFEMENIIVKPYYPFYTYQLDFADPDLKIDIEIDGAQHRYDQRIVKHDLKRNNFMASKGWKVYRVYWPEYQKKTIESKKEIITEIRNLLNQ